MPGCAAISTARRSIAMLAEHAAARRNPAMQLWSLLTLEVFLRREGW